MKPISVEFQAFGPYENKEFVDFETLAQDGLFLIDGKTGSGKTMILDAITFALYGKSSGSTRDDLEQLRCSHCDPKADTYVKFVFEEKGTRYSFERRLAKKTKNLSEEFHALIIDKDGATIKTLSENCKAKEMTKIAEELIGLSFDQFRQVIILPQGKFEKLLTSDSKDKEAILAQIFNAGKWKAIADRYYEKAESERKRLNEIKTKVDNSLDEDGCKNLADLEKKSADLMAEIKLKEEEFKKADYNSKKNDLNAQNALASDFDTLSNYNEELNKLKAKEQEIEEDKKALETAEKAESLRKPLEALDAAHEELEDRTEDDKEANEELKAANEAFEDAKTALEELKKNEKEYQKNKKAKTELELKKETYESINDLENKLNKAEEKKDSLSKEAENLESAAKDAIEALSQAAEELSDAESHEKATRDSYMSGITGHIAEDLKEGEVCPVCGNTHHPKLAVLPEGCADAKALEKAEKARKEKNAAWKKANEVREKAGKELEEKKAELADANTLFETAKNDVNNAKKALVKGIESLADFNKKVAFLEKEIESYEVLDEKLNKALDDAKQSHATAEKGVQTSKKELEKAAKEAEKAKKALDEALEKTEFKDADSAKDAMLDANEINELREGIKEYNTKVKEYTKLSSELSKKLEGKVAPDAEAIKEELHAIEDAEKEYNTQHGKNMEYHRHLSTKFTDISKEYKVYEDGIKAAQSNFTFAKLLRGDSGVGLQRYVLGIMFSSVIHEANEMLKNVAGGRYTLFRTSEKGDNGNKRGLDLKVMDNCGGSKDGRSVSTLSGGEKFLASLALSIGLAGIAKTGGVDIEGIFIDEGFGTLDEDCIGDALDILKGVQKKNGLVGIISHVELLRSTIYPQLQVKVDENKASHIEMC